MRPTVVVIGGGVMGCAVALRLAQKGERPLVLERSVPGAEASSAAAGMLAPQEEADGPGPSFELGMESRRRYPALARELEAATGVEIGYRQSGLLAVGDASAVEALERRAAWQLRHGLSIEELSPAAVRGLEPALGEFPIGLRFPDEAQVSPPRLMRALQLAAARAGASFEAAYVRRVRHDGQRVEGVEAERGFIECPRVVVAAGSWSGLLEGVSMPERAIRPVRGQIVELETRPPLFRHLVFVHGAQKGYLVPRPDGAVLVGSTMEEAGYRKDVTVRGLHGLLSLATRAVPALAEAPVRGSWSNFRPATVDGLPLLGPTQVLGLWLATGHFRNGILLAPITADIMAALVRGEPPPVDVAPFSPLRLSPSSSSTA